jgi:hypothetical protein
MLDKHKSAKAADYERESEKTETYQDTKLKAEAYLSNTLRRGIRQPRWMSMHECLRTGLNADRSAELEISRKMIRAYNEN